MWKKCMDTWELIRKLHYRKSSEDAIFYPEGFTDHIKPHSERKEEESSLEINSIAQASSSNTELLCQQFLALTARSSC